MFVAFPVRNCFVGLQRVFSTLHRLLWELLEWHAGVEPIAFHKGEVLIRPVKLAQPSLRVCQPDAAAFETIGHLGGESIAVGHFGGWLSWALAPFGSCRQYHSG